MLQLSKVAGRYAIERLLYSRGFSTGYLARDEHDRGAEVVVELALRESSSDRSRTHPGEYRGLIGALGSMEHPNLAPILRFVEDDPYYGVVKSWEPGMVLADWLASMGSDSEEDSEEHRVRLCRDLLEGLAALHELGILHRALTPRSIWLAYATAGRPVAQIDDFHAAILAPEGEVGGFTPLGPSPLLHAPEVAREGMCSTRSDVYSAGLILLELLSEGPVAALDPANPAWGDEHAGGGRLTPETVRGLVPQPFTEVVVRATQPYRVERFRDGLDLLAAFDAMDLQRRLGDLGFD